MKKQDKDSERNEYEVLMVMAGGGEMLIGTAFDVDNGDTVVMLQAMPINGQMRLRKVAP